MEFKQLWVEVKANYYQNVLICYLWQLLSATVNFIDVLILINISLNYFI